VQQAPPDRPAPSAGPLAPEYQAVLRLQRLAGNRAVFGLVGGGAVQREETLFEMLTRLIAAFATAPAAPQWTKLPEAPNVYLRRVDAATPPNPALKVVLEETKEEAGASLQSNADTTSRLYLTYTLTADAAGKLRAAVTGAELRCKIRVRPEREFGSLDDFAPYYMEFRDLAAGKDAPKTAGEPRAVLIPSLMSPPSGRRRERALDEFCRRHTVQVGGSPTVDFPHPRLSTLQHEAEHVRDAERSYHQLLPVFLREVQAHLNGRKGLTPDEADARFVDFASRQWATWNGDPGEKLHGEIVENQCRLMIELYEVNVLGVPAGGRLGAMVDPLADTAGGQLAGD
jgi:hypothetical protein